jgi:hypothetical protein
VSEVVSKLACQGWHPWPMHAWHACLPTLHSHPFPQISMFFTCKRMRLLPYCALQPLWTTSERDLRHINLLETPLCLVCGGFTTESEAL